MKKVLIGTSGYTYKDWKGIFYPEKLPQKEWLCYYAQHFATVEINATFYGSFQRATYQKWAEKTPKDFVFAIKGTRFVTHIKRLTDVRESIERFFNQASGLGEKLSCVLWQFPGSFRLGPPSPRPRTVWYRARLRRARELGRLRKFLEILPKGIRQAIEFRHESWFVDDVFALLNKHNAGLVMSDAKGFPYEERVTDSFVYIRFHGPGRLYASSYSDRQLTEWAERIKEYRKKYPIYCYFNNDFHGYAIENAKTLEKLIDK